ncbi:MAG: hypothetical protein IJM27_02225 [Eubacterium sp.]|nr:hypothetical protein [Eubacterium sp.]
MNEESRFDKMKRFTESFAQKASEGGQRVKTKAKEFTSKTKEKADDSKTALIKAIDQDGDGQIDSTDIILLAMKTPGVKIDRAGFLRKELYKTHSEEEIERAIATSPLQAGIPAEEIDKIVDEVIKFERNAVSGISTLLGMPGGAAMVATIPADIAQYYGYMLRAAQKMMYLYGFPALNVETEDGVMLDSETINSLTVCMGIMYGVATANNAMKAIAKAFATGVEKKLMRAALTKGTIYPIVKSVAKWFGVRMTKEVFAGFFKKAIPVVGGVIGGGITYATFKPCCYRLKNTLKDTALSNPNHISSEEENILYEGIKGDIIDGEAVEIFDEVTETEVEQNEEPVNKGLYLEGVIESLNGVSESEFMERFLVFMDENGWYWNGNIEDVDN